MFPPAGISFKPTFSFNLDGVKWTISAIILLSIFYTYTVIQFTSPPVSPHRGNPKFSYLARARRLRKARRELEEQRSRIVKSGSSFRFLDLPPELTFLVLANCLDWPGMYSSLVLVSRCCQRSTFHVFLPHTPVKLIFPQQVHSFGLLLCQRPELAALVRHLWVTPYTSLSSKEDLLRPCVEIVKKCRNLKSLASNAYIVQESITFRRSHLSHLDCKNLTLVSTSTAVWASLLATPNVLALFRQLTHLRLMGNRFPTNIPLPNLTHLSYGIDTADNIGMAMLADPVSCPSLDTVIVTNLTASKGLRISRAAHSRFFTFELPRTELGLWCDNVSHRGMWALCADSIHEISKEVHHLNEISNQ